MEGPLKLLTLAVRIAIAWTLLSLLLVAFWALLLEVGRRLGTKPASKPCALEERQLSAEVRAICSDSSDDQGVCGEAFVQSDIHEIGERSDAIVFVWWSSVHKR